MRRNNTPLKLKTPHLLKLNINKTKGVTNATKLNIQKEHFHFFKMQKSPMNNTKEKNYITTENEQLSNKNQKLKLISSNGQNYFCFNQNKGESGIKIISKKEPSELPYMNTDYRTKTLNTINSDCISMNQYRKLSKEQIQRIRQLKTMNTITHTNTLTDSSITKDETKSRMERSKSTLNTKSISLRNNKLKVLKRSLSNKRNVLKILDDTIKGLTKLKTIILDDEEEEEYKPMIMAKSKKPDELDLSEENKHCSELDTLIPKEVKELIEKYKEEMNKYITSVISQYENEQKLNDALSSMNLPSAVLDNTDMSYLNTVEISDYLWKQIEDIQQRDGTLGLMNIIGDIERRSFELEKRLRDAMNWLGTEEKEDYFYRNQFGEGKWIREPSNKYNQGFYQGLQGYIMSLNQSRPFDQNQKGDVMESAKYFEMFALTRLELNMRIPGRQNQGEKPTLSLKEEDIKTGLQEIKEMGINCTKIIRNIYSTLNEDSTLVSSFIEVVNNQITAEKVLEDNKPKFQPLFEELQKLSSEVHEKVIQLRNMCNALEKNPEVENKKQLLNEQIDAFMNNLQTYINMYNAKFEQLQKGVGYYNNLQNKIHEMLNSVYRYLNKRNEEKIYLIQIITKRQMEPPIPIELLPVIQEEQPKEYPEDDFLDPSKNIITNMNTTYTFGNTFQGKVNMRPMPANYQNNNYNQFPNNNNFPQQNYPNNGYYK